MIDPYKALRDLAGIDVTDGAGDVREHYRERYGVGGVAERFWNDPAFTLGFEYGLLALAALLEEAVADRPDGREVAVADRPNWRGVCVDCGLRYFRTSQDAAIQGRRPCPRCAEWNRQQTEDVPHQSWYHN